MKTVLRQGVSVKRIKDVSVKQPRLSEDVVVKGFVEAGMGVRKLRPRNENMDKLVKAVATSDRFLLENVAVDIADALRKAKGSSSGN